MTTCTVTVSATDGFGKCGKPAVWTNGEFAECADHAADPGSLANWKPAKTGSYNVGDVVKVHRYGKTYDATVVHAGSRGGATAEFTYDNGAKRTVRV